MLSSRSRVFVLLSGFFLVILVFLHNGNYPTGFSVIEKPVPGKPEPGNRPSAEGAQTELDPALPAESKSPPSSTPSEDFIETKFFFQEDLKLRQPKVDLKEFKKFAPHRYNPDEQQQTFATFLCTPNASIHDPYFAATLNLVYRNLWSPKIASKTRPFTVFVAPFITQEQRDILAGAGAVVQELGLLPWEPHVAGVYNRWRDQFSKLHFFNQTQFSAIAYMDSDAFPLKNIDAVFDEIKPQKCDPSKMDADELKDKDELCDYTFMGIMNFGGGINGGFIVVRPNLAMHRRLLRNYVKVDEYDNTAAEQSFFKWMFAEKGPLPVRYIDRKYNGYFPKDDEEGKLSVVHEKLWSLVPPMGEGWLGEIWPKGWEEMVTFFDSPEFLDARKKDGTV